MDEKQKHFLGEVRGENNGGVKGALPPNIGPMRQTCPTNILALGVGKIFGANPKIFSTADAVLENFWQIFEKLA